jgi:hypothetical protein
MSSARIQKLVALSNAKTLTADEEKKLSAKLTESGYPGNGVTSVDGSQHYPPFTIYKSLFFFKKYAENHDRDMLNQACEWGLFDALVKRCELNQAAIKESNDSEKMTAKSELLADLDKLGNLYWSVGYIHSARILLDIANYYDQKNKEECGGTTSPEEGYLAMATSYHEEAARNYYRAKFLLSQPISLQITALIYQERGLKACGWDSVEKAEEDILVHVEKTRSHNILKEVQVDIVNSLRSNKQVNIRR